MEVKRCFRSALRACSWHCSVVGNKFSGSQMEKAKFSTQNNKHYLPRHFHYVVEMQRMKYLLSFHIVHFCYVLN